MLKNFYEGKLILNLQGVDVDLDTIWMPACDFHTPVYHQELVIFKDDEQLIENFKDGLNACVRCQFKGNLHDN
jgi:hypothetical protein